MYIIDLPSNSLTKIERTSFKALKLEERKHLQEWIAKEPSSLGEDLLIIQNELKHLFSDFIPQSEESQTIDNHD